MTELSPGAIESFPRQALECDSTLTLECDTTPTREPTPGPKLAEAVGEPCLEDIWSALAAVPDPEIPVISVVDLGIVRDISWHEDEDRKSVV